MDRLTLKMKEKEETEYYMTRDLFYQWLADKNRDYKVRNMREYVDYVSTMYNGLVNASIVI